jgi:type I restriction enzyme, S subunit
MKSSYKRLGDFIQKVNVRNNNSNNTKLVGLSMTKEFRPHASNIIGTDLSKYKVIDQWQFACDFMSTIRVRKLPVVMQEKDEQIIVSPAYTTFEVIDSNKLHPEYLMMWFRRSEFDRYAYFCCDSAVRGGFNWDELCDVQLSVPSIEKQRAIVKEYNSIVDRIKLKEQLNQKLEATAQALYKHWFVDFEFPNEYGKPYKSSGGEMVYNEELNQEIPVGWDCKIIENISDLKYGKMLSSSKFLEKGYLVFSGYGIRGFYSEYMYENPEILVLCRGVSGTGEVRMSPAKSYITNLSIVVDIIDDDMNKQFLYHYLKNQNLRSLDSGSAQSQITIGDLNCYRILYPEVEIQEQFGKHILQLEQKDINNKKQISTLTELSDILLSRLSMITPIQKELSM